MNIGNVILTLAAINAILYEDVKERKERKLPFKVKLKLVRIKDALEKDAQVYEQERVRLVQELGDPVEGTETLEVRDPKKLEKFYASIEEIFKTETEPVYPRLTQEELALIEDIAVDITEAQVRAFFEYVVEKKE